MADNDFPVPQQGAEQSTALATASGAETESSKTARWFIVWLFLLF